MSAEPESSNAPLRPPRLKRIEDGRRRIPKYRASRDRSARRLFRFDRRQGRYSPISSPESSSHCSMSRFRAALRLLQRSSPHSKRSFLPYCVHTGHGGYMGLITASPLPIGVIGDLIASALNQNLGAYSIGPSAVAMERRTVRWLCDLVGYGAEAGGNLTSGGMAANLIGLKLARDRASGQQAQETGCRGRWAVYTSEERHVSVDKAADAVGLGRESIRPIVTDDEFRIRLDELDRAIASGTSGRECGQSASSRWQDPPIQGPLTTWSVFAGLPTATECGCTPTRPTGVGLLLSHSWSHLLAGIELADSITIDPHKWFFAPH